MSKRINIILPTATVETIDRLARPGMRSKFIATAVEHYVAHRSTEALRARLEKTAIRDQDLDREIANDWFAVDQEAWRKLDNVQQAKSRQNAATSTSRRLTRR